MTLSKGGRFMETISKEFSLFIDGIRIEKGLSRIDLIDGIVSLSQYKRYLRGVASFPNDVIIKIANRLNYDITDLYSLYSKKYNKEDLILREIYKLIQSFKYKEAELKLNEVNSELLISNYYKTFYDYLSLHTQHKLGRVSDVHVLSLYSNLINYPNCMNSHSFNMVELNVLNQITIVSSTMENYEPANLLYRVFTSGNFSSTITNDSSILPSIYYTVARVNYKQEYFERTIELTNLGIGISLSNDNIKILPYLYYLNARANKNHGDDEAAILSVKKCFLHLISMGNKAVYETFLKLYNQTFETPLEDLLSNITNLI